MTKSIMQKTDWVGDSVLIYLFDGYLGGLEVLLAFAVLVRLCLKLYGGQFPPRFDVRVAHNSAVELYMHGSPSCHPDDD